MKQSPVRNFQTGQEGFMSVCEYRRSCPVAVSHLGYSEAPSAPGFACLGVSCFGHQVPKGRNTQGWAPSPEVSFISVVSPALHTLQSLTPQSAQPKLSWNSMIPWMRASSGSGRFNWIQLWEKQLPLKLSFLLVWPFLPAHKAHTLHPQSPSSTWPTSWNSSSFCNSH